MAKEIERKFLLKNDNWRLDAEKQKVKPSYFKQIYLTNEPWGVVRLRQIKNPEYSQAFITIKTRSNTISRDEYEYEIPYEDATEMFSKFEHENGIEKNRYCIEYKGKIFEIDEFLGANQGLVVAELELESIDQNFEAPEWLGEEVSKISKYFNSELAKKK